MIQFRDIQQRVQRAQLLQERSHNDPIPEMNQKEKLAIFLIGPPGTGKSTFTKNWLYRFHGPIRIFSTDEVNRLYQKKLQNTDSPDENKYYEPSADFNVKLIRSFLQDGGPENFIFEVTGNFPKNFLAVLAEATKAGYLPLFIHFITPLKLSLRRQFMRNRQAPEDFIRWSYRNLKNVIKMYAPLNPDHYYFVFNDGVKHVFYKLVNGKIVRIKTEVGIA